MAQPTSHRAITSSLAAAVIVILTGLAGCSSISPRFSNMTSAYSEAVQEHDRNQLLINMLLASRNLPLQFTAVPSVIGTGTISSSAYLGAEVYGPGDTSWGRFFAPTPGSMGTFGGSLSTSRQFNFTLSSLDNEQFAKGFLADISIENIHAFTSTKDIPVRLKYMLFFESMTVNPDAPDEIVFYNGADKVRSERFQQALDRARAAGLRTELVSVTTPIGPALSREEAVAMTKLIVQRDDGSLAVRKIDAPAPDQYRVESVRRVARFCFDRAINQRDARLRISPDLYCGRKDSGAGIVISNSEAVEWRAPTNAGVDDEMRIENVGLNLRSSLDIFRYLGSVINAQLNPENPWTMTIRSKQEDGAWQERPLLVVRKGEPPSGTPVIATARLFDESYYVPMDDDSYSALVFQIASVVVTTSKVPGSIPASPGVLLK